MKFSLFTASLALLSAGSAHAACTVDVKVEESAELAVDANGNGEVNPGDTVEYTITMTNVGAEAVAAGDLTVVGPLTSLMQQSFVPGSCTYADRTAGTKSPCADDSLNGDGLKSMYDLAASGGIHFVRFQAVVADIEKIYNLEVSNVGLLDIGQRYCPDKKFSVTLPLVLEPEVTLVKTVHLGHSVDCEAKFALSNADDKKLAQGFMGTEVTYCYHVINSGATYLDPKSIVDEDIGYSSMDMTNSLAPGETMYKAFRTTIDNPINTQKVSTATVSANPIYYMGGPIPGLPDVTDINEATVKTLMQNADVSIDKTVHLGHWEECSTGRDLEQGVLGKNVTYCYEVKNLGQTYLKDVQLSDSNGATLAPPAEPLAPGASFFVKMLSTITETASTSGVVVAMPSDANGNAINGAALVRDRDAAGVVLHQMDEAAVHCPPGGYMYMDKDGYKGVKNDAP